MAQKEKSGEKVIKRFAPLDDSMICIQVGQDLTFEAQEGRIPAVLGREAEINRILTLLSRPGMRNIILTGDPGVGKTSLIGEIANRVATGRVPASLLETRFIQTSFSDLWAYVANSENWGKYLETLKTLLDECEKKNLILFMDEIHTLFHHHYSMQYLRASLASGKLTIIGATTDQEYYTFIDKDRATARRFQIYHVNETNDATTLEILKSSARKYKSANGFEMPSDEVLQYLVSLSNAYIPYLFQPSKALSILDDAVVSKLIAGDTSPLTKVAVRQATCKMVGIPEEAISSPKERLQAMEEVLNAHILGQEEAIAKLCRRLFISKAAMSVTPDRPDGVFLLAGPTGVGKTELARALAAYINGNEKDLIRVDMSALAEPGSISALLGMPGLQSMSTYPQDVPLLTRKLRVRPYSVLLLDEIEKAHRSVHLLFLQAFDTGQLIDNLGNEIYFSNTVVIMTTNLGFSVRQPIISMPGQSVEKLVKEQEDASMKTIKAAFPPEFLGRVDDILFFKPLTAQIMKGFVGQKIHQLEKITGKKINATEEAVSLLCDKGFDPEYGARDLNRAVDELLGYKLALFKFSVDWDAVKALAVSKSKGKDELEITAVIQKG